jgi:hypothetical protein
VIRAVYNSASSAIRIIADAFAGAGTTGLVPDPGVEANTYLKDDGTWGTPASVAIYEEADGVTLNNGTSASSLSDLQTMLDGNTYDIAEEVGAPGINVEIEFAGVIEINQVIVSAYYSGSPTHAVRIQLYNYNDAAWDTIHTINDGRDIEQHFKTIVDDSDYILSGNAIVRLYHAENGNGSHNLYIDYVGLGYATSPAAWHARSHTVTSTADHTAGTHKLFYSDGSGDVQELAHGLASEVLTSGGPAAAPSWTPVGHFGAYLEDDIDVSDEWTDIPVKSATKTNFTHVDGEAEIIADNAGTYMIAVTLIADYNTDNEIHYIKGSLWYEL